MFKTRLISGIILVLLALLFIITGNDLLLVVCAVISIIGLMELYRIFHIHKSILGIVGYFGTFLYYIYLKFHFIAHTEMILILYLMLLMFVYVFSYPKYNTEQILAAFFGLFYVSVMLSYIYQTRMLPMGAYSVWFIFLCSWGSDTCAYCVGVLFGKHKMTPKLSPKKSWEGAIGGVAGAALLAIIYGFVFQNKMHADTTRIFIMAAICAIGAIISMIGDLTASAIKRNYNIKDYGKLIPGHGGILDRFDSVIFTAPIIYYLVFSFMK